MDVLHEPHRRALAGDRVEPLEPGREELLPLGRRLYLGRADGAEQLGDHRRARLGRARGACQLDELARISPATRELADRLERREHVGPQARAQDRRSVCGGRQLVEQSCLADAGWRDDRDPCGRADERTEVFQLGFAAECRRAQAAERTLSRPLGMNAHGAPGRHGLGLSLEIERRQSLQLDRVGDGERSRLADRDRLGLARSLQPRGDVHDVTGDRPALRARLAVDGLAARDADAHAQRARLEPEGGADPLHRCHERQPRPHSTLGIVVADARRAEDGHRGVADELLQLAAVTRNRLPHRLEVRVLHERDVLGVEPLRQRREPDEVGEENRDDPPLERPLGGHRASLTPRNQRHKAGTGLLDCSRAAS